MSTSHELLESYLNSNSVVQHQLESYNRFTSITLPKIIENHSVIEPDVSDFAIKLSGIRLEMPKVIEVDSSTRSITPNEAISRNLTYSSGMYITYTPMISGIEKRDSTGEIFIGELPVMVKSDLCYLKNMSREQLIRSGEDPDDPGGYFIIRGTERVLIGIEDLAPNRVMSSKSGRNVVSKIFSTTLNFKSRCSVERDAYGMFTISFPKVTKGIDLVLVLRALGLTMNEILDSTTNADVKNDLVLNIEMSKAKDMSQSDALGEVGRISVPSQSKSYQEKRAEMQIDTYLLPHLGIDEKARRAKAYYLLRMAERNSLIAYKYIKQDDKDHYANKRVRFAGDLLEDLFNESFKSFVQDIKYHVERTIARGRKLSVRTSINPDTLTEKLLYSMGTGAWPGGYTGVSQVLDRLNMVSTLAHLRRIKSPLAKKHAHFKARDIHGTHVGKICPSETPEGGEVGLTRYLAITARVSFGADEEQLKGKLKELKLL
ncbi:MAG: DNA-directed RNA polymerase subunit B'' [Candidatus Micrarchaeaceae archaeon]